MNRMQPSHPSAPTRAERLEDALNREEQGRTTLPREIERYADDDETLAADLGLIATVRQIEPSPNETAEACARVGRRLQVLLASGGAARGDATAPSEPANTGAIRLTIPARLPAGKHLAQSSSQGPSASQSAHDAVTVALKAPTPRQPRRRRPSGVRMVALVAALLLIVFGVALTVSNAAATTLPESPLYGVKLANEWLALQFAWTDTQRGQALAQIADHRLTEASAEARTHPAEAQALTRESDAAISQMITLLGQMRAQHENIGVVAQALSDELVVEQTTLAQAQHQGLTGFAQTLTLTLQNEQSAIAARHLPVGIPAALPATPTVSDSDATTASPNDQQHNHPTGTPGDNGNGSSEKPTGTPGAGPHPTPTPHGKHNGNGDGGSGHGGSGHGNGGVGH